MPDYATEGAVWGDPDHVTWSFADKGGTFTNAMTGPVQTLVLEALAAWSATVRITFVQVPDDTTPAAMPDIRIGWGALPGTQIGETDYVYTTNPKTKVTTFKPGVAVLAEDPALRPLTGTGDLATYANTDATLLQTLVHEIGHALGLDHSSQATSVMYPTLGPANRAIGRYDAAGIQSLYAARDGYVPPADPPPAPTPSSAASDSEAYARIAPVYRFFDGNTGTQMLTADLGECNRILQTRPDLKYEGIAFSTTGIPPSDPTVVAVRRLFDPSNGSHFLTASADEVAGLAASRADMTLESGIFYEDAVQCPGDVPVYRFFDSVHGTHAFTSSEDERASIAATRPDLIAEGIAFYAPRQTHL